MQDDGTPQPGPETGPPDRRRRAINALIRDRRNRNATLGRLVETIKRESEIVHGPAPNGLEPGEPDRYRAMIRAAVVEQAAIQTALGILGPDGLLDDSWYGFVDAIDKSGMLERLGCWEHHLTTMQGRALETAHEFTERHRGTTVRKVKVYGLGGSAAPHDLTAEIINNFRKTSAEIEVVHADTPNPDHVDGSTLVVLASFSGDTEETIQCYRTVRHKTDLLVALAKGGQLRSIARMDGIPFIQLPEEPDHPAFVLQPRESVCLQMTATLAFLGSIELPPGSAGAFRVEDLAIVEGIVPLVQRWNSEFGPERRFRDNPAKQLAFFLLYGIDYPGRGKLEEYDLWDKKVPFILVDRNNRAVGHEARTQIHERAKLNAAYYEAPEFLHNLVESIRAGVESSQAHLGNDVFTYYIIRSVDEESRIRLRLDKTMELVVEGKGSYAALNVEGNDPYQRALFATYFNAYMTTYLAILNGFDPLPVPTMSWLKRVMEHFPREGNEEQEAQRAQRPVVDMRRKSA